MRDGQEDDLLRSSVRVLVTGATGLLGSALIAQAPKGYELFATSRQATRSCLSGREVPFDLDIVDTSALLQALNGVRPDVIVHTAAEGSVDAVQANKENFVALNVNAAVQIANWCSNHSCHFVYVSSNAVFGGRPTPYADDDELCPINDYGRLKADAEVAVASALPSAFIFRPILMYGWPTARSRMNPVAHWVSHLRNERRLKIVDDVITQPLASWDAARAIWRAVEVGSSGPINASGGESLFLYDFAVLTAETFELDTSLITGIKSSELDGLAPRPHCTMFDNKRLTNELEIKPVSPRQGLRVMRMTEASLMKHDA